MAVADRLQRRARAHPRLVTAVVSVFGYGLVVGAFAGVIPFPDVGRSGVVILSDAIAVVNTVALVALLAGVRFVRAGEIARHRVAMLTAFGLIMTFLVLYLLKVGGGFEKHLVVSEGQFLWRQAGLVRAGYLAMLVVHVALSVLTVPVVLHAVVLGVTHPTADLASTSHPRVGRIAVVAWTLSLALGVLTYVLLNHVYGWEVGRRAVVPLLAVAGPSLRRR